VKSKQFSNLKKIQNLNNFKFEPNSKSEQFSNLNKKKKTKKMKRKRKEKEKRKSTAAELDRPTVQNLPQR
jgi:hypothetical protein